MYRSWIGASKIAFVLLACYLDYHIAGFLREDFNFVTGLIRNIKIREVFNPLHFVTRVH